MSCLTPCSQRVFICELPDAVLRLLVAVRRLVTGHDNGVYVNAFILRANSVTNVLLAVNSSVNFIIYFLVGNKFREILARECGCEAVQHRRSPGPVGARFLQTPDTLSTAGLASGGGGVDGGSHFGSTDRRDGFVWSSRRAGFGGRMAPRSPTTEHGGWQRAQFAGGGLLVVRDDVTVIPSGTTSVVELEICPCKDTMAQNF